jgi:ribonuclease P protein component
MNREQGERFSKQLRLRKRGEYLRVQRSGKKLHSRAFIGLVLLQNIGTPRLGITTSKRLGNAVERNRIRRLAREAFRRSWMTVPINVDLVLIAKKQAVSMTNPEIMEDLGALGKQLERLKESFA